MSLAFRSTGLDEGVICTTQASHKKDQVLCIRVCYQSGIGPAAMKATSPNSPVNRTTSCCPRALQSDGPRIPSARRCSLKALRPPSAHSRVRPDQTQSAASTHEGARRDHAPVGEWLVGSWGARGPTRAGNCGALTATIGTKYPLSLAQGLWVTACGRTRKPEWSKGHRGFESHPLRHVSFGVSHLAGGPFSRLSRAPRHLA